MTMKAVCLKSLDNMGILEMNWKKKLAFDDKNYEEPFPNQSVLSSICHLRRHLCCALDFLISPVLCWNSEDSYIKALLSYRSGHWGGSYRQYKPHLYGDTSALYQG